VHVEDLAAAEAKLTTLGAREPAEHSRTYGNTEGSPDDWIGEWQWLTPGGILIDVDQSGWRITPGGARGD
jgi:hypothetical protein